MATAHEDLLVFVPVEKGRRTAGETSRLDLDGGGVPSSPDRLDIGTTDADTRRTGAR
jgi:hypothetical protein